MDQLKTVAYDDLAVGGAVNTSIAGFSDNPDIESDGQADYTRRWRISELGLSKTIEVRVIAQLAASGTVKESSVVALVTER